MALGLTALGALLAAVCLATLGRGLWGGDRAGPAAISPAPHQRPAPRLVVLSPALGVIARDLGRAGRVVGRHAFDLVLDPALKVCGDQGGIDYEALLAVGPTHVLIEHGAGGVPARLDRLARERGWGVEVFPMRSLDDIRSATLRLDRLTGAATPSADAAGLLREMDRAWARRGGGFAPAGRVLLLAQLDPIGALGPGSFHQEILEQIGGVPAIREGSAFIRLDVEDLLRLAPDAIVLILPRDARAQGAGSTIVTDPAVVGPLLGRAGTLDIPAVRQGRLGLIEGPLTHTPSTAMIGLADDLARVLEQWSR